MKKNFVKMIALLMALILVFSLVSCVVDPDAVAVDQPPEPSEQPTEEPIAASPSRPDIPDNTPAADPAEELPEKTDLTTEIEGPEETPAPASIAPSPEPESENADVGANEPEETVTPEPKPEETEVPTLRSGYSTGDPELDAELAEILGTVVSDELSDEENIHNLYRYVRDNFRYRKKAMRSAEDIPDWVFVAAKEMIEDGAGNCYSFSSLLYCVFRAYGFEEARYCIGLFCNSPHGWVEAEIDGVRYIYDVETEFASLSKDRLPKTYVDCYHRTPEQLKQYVYAAEGEFSE